MICCKFSSCKRHSPVFYYKPEEKISIIFLLKENRLFRELLSKLFPPNLSNTKDYASKQPKSIFTITAEILARSLANFYRQYADRHMNLKFVRRVSERERAIRPFVIVKNKLTSVFHASVLLLTMNFVITLSK